MIIPNLNSHGKLNGSPGFIKDEVCPRVPYLSYKNIPLLLKEISENTDIKWFAFDGRYWLHAIKFNSEHQNLREDRLGNDKLPSYSPGLSPDLVHNEVEGEVEEEVELKDPTETVGIPLKNPKRIDLKAITVLNLDEPAKHKLYNLVIDLFKVRGWDTESDLALKVFKSVAEKVNEAKPDTIFPYFEKSLKTYLNQNAELISAQTKINRKNDPKTKTIGEILNVK